MTIPGLLLAACLNGPFFPGPGTPTITCSPARQAVQCGCSECMTWDPPTDLGTVDGYQVFRWVSGFPRDALLVGFLPCNEAWSDEDGNTYPRRCRTTWCFALDAPAVPTVGTTFEYAVRAVRALQVGNLSPSVKYVAAPYDCWDRGWIPCFPGDLPQER